MQLRDILKEDASEEAKRMGLEYYGFGQYGKNGVTTHISQNGSLVPKPQQPTDANRQQTTTAPASIDKPQDSSDDEKFDAYADMKGIGRKRSYKSKGLSEIGDNVRNTMGSESRITDVNKTLSAITSYYGRETAPPVQRGGPVMDELIQLGYTPEEVGAVYNFNSDTIELSAVDDISDTPVSEWDQRQLHSFETHVHESIHSASPRLKPGSTWLNSGLQVAIEEGLTEYLAQGITESTVGVDHPHMESINEGGGYRGNVDGIELMVTYGSLDVDTTFRNPNGNGVKNAIRDAETVVIMKTLQRVDIQSNDSLANQLLGLRGRYLDNDSMMLFDEKVAAVFVNINQELDAGGSLTADEIRERFKEIL